MPQPAAGVALLRAGASPNLTDKMGNLPLHFACRGKGFGAANSASLGDGATVGIVFPVPARLGGAVYVNSDVIVTMSRVLCGARLQVRASLVVPPWRR